jgi:YD repeat-containing protein
LKRGFTRAEEKELLRGKDLVYWRFYRHNTSQLTSTQTLTKAGRAIGLWTEYDDHGKLVYIVDRDHGTWRVASRQAYPFFALQGRVKAQADSLIAAAYGQPFLRAHAIWNVQGSAIYNAQESGNWTDSFTAPPTRFLFRYDVRLDAQHVYPEMLQFELDAQGRLLPPSLEPPLSPTRRRPQLPSRFRLRYATALQLVQRLSHVRNVPLTGFLQWEGLPRLQEASLYTGHLRFYVPVLTSSEKDLHPQGRSERIDHFTVYVFDPWTGTLLATRKMKSVHGWEARSGSSTGLLPE